MRGWLVLAFVVGCKPKDEAALQPPPPPAKPSPAAGKPLRQAKVEETYIVVLPKGADADAAAKRVAAKLAPLGGEALATPPVNASPELRAAAHAMNKDLTDADLDGMLTNRGVALKATGEPVATMRAVATIARDLAKEQHGWVIDPDAGRAYTAPQFATHVPGDPIDVREVIAVHGVQGDNAQPFLDTMGMTKLGLPELRVSAAAAGQLRALTVLIDATAQRLVAKDVVVPGTLDVDLAALPGEWHVEPIKSAGGSAKARWRIAWGNDPDSGGEVLELVPAQGSGVEGAVALLDDCFGKTPDPVAQIAADDPELKVAATQARADLLRRRAHFAKGVPPGEHLAIKAPFHDGDITEWMWVDVVAWTGDTFEGSLDNDPESVTNVKVGQTVRVKLADVADFTALAADGSQSGGYSIAVMTKRGLLH